MKIQFTLNEIYSLSQLYIQGILFCCKFPSDIYPDGFLALIGYSNKGGREVVVILHLMYL